MVEGEPAGGSRPATTPTPVSLLPRAAGPKATFALLRPPCVVLVNTLSVVGPMPPIGLAYVAAALRTVGHRVQVIDAAGEALDRLHEYDTHVGTMRRIGLSPQEAIDRIDPGTQIIGLTHMFLHEWPMVREMAELARARFPDAVIVVGGENATAFRRWIFEQCPAIDVVVMGEGEPTAVALADRVAEGLGYADLPGLASRSGGEVVDNGLPVRMRKLLDVPRPAWDLFPMDEYFGSRNWLGVDRGRSMPLLATRGCPYKCTFCSSPQMWTTRYVVRDPEDIVDEIADYVARYRIADFIFVDLTAMTKRRWTLAFCDALEARDLDITWQIPVGTRSEGIDSEVLRRLHETGCRNITYAPEHGSTRMLEIFDKRLDLDHILEDVRAAHRLGMVVHVNTIIGHPAELWRDRWLNLVFLMKAALAGADTGSPQMFHPYPGSKDFQDLYDAGRIQIDDAFYYDGLSKASPQHNSWNDGITSRQLYLTQVVMLAAFFGLRPWRVVRSFIRAVGRGHEESLLDQMFRTKIRGPLRVTRRRSRSRVTPPPGSARPPEATPDAA